MYDYHLLTPGVRNKEPSTELNVELHKSPIVTKLVISLQKPVRSHTLSYNNGVFQCCWHTHYLSLVERKFRRSWLRYDGHQGVRRSIPGQLRARHGDGDDRPVLARPGHCSGRYYRRVAQRLHCYEAAPAVWDVANRVSSPNGLTALLRMTSQRCGRTYLRADSLY